MSIVFMDGDKYFIPYIPIQNSLHDEIGKRITTGCEQRENKGLFLIIFLQIISLILQNVIFRTI